MNVLHGHGLQRISYLNEVPVTADMESILFQSCVHERQQVASLRCKVCE